MRKIDKQSGFSAVELLVTLFVTVAFVSIFYQLFVIIDQLSADGYHKSVASSIAYSNLRKYVNSAPATWLVCDSSTDIKTNPSGTGQVLLSGSLVVADLPGSVTQSVIADAPYGCTGTDQGMPVRVRSTITYGPNSTEVSHASYAGF